MTWDVAESGSSSLRAMDTVPYTEKGSVGCAVYRPSSSSVTCPSGSPPHVPRHSPPHVPATHPVSRSRPLLTPAVVPASRPQRVTHAGSRPPEPQPHTPAPALPSSSRDPLQARRPGAPETARHGYATSARALVTWPFPAFNGARRAPTARNKAAGLQEARDRLTRVARVHEGGERLWSTLTLAANPNLGR